MSLYKTNRSKHVGCVATNSIFFLLFFISSYAETGLRLPPPRKPFTQFHFSSKTPTFLPSSPLLFQSVQYPRGFTYAVIIDSSGKYVTLSRTFHNRNIFIPYHQTFEDYLQHRSSFEARNLWKEYAYTYLGQKSKRTDGRGGLTIETPKIKSEAFKRVFGGETLSLNVRGKITIDGTMRHEKRSQVRTATDRAPNTNFQMKQTQKFTVEGKIGENVSILVNQDSERPFEFENAIKLKYSSDEDGIIKSIEAGNVALSLPSTRFVTFSAQNTGLFGIKTQIKIANLDLTTIVSIEKGEKKTLSLTGGKEEDTYRINDYEYRKNTYFFLDHGYKIRYPMLDNLGRHIVNPDSFIAKIEVYKSDYNYEIKPGSIRSWAVLDPDPQSVDTSFTTTENYRGYFLRLEPITDYYVKPELGYIVMTMPLQESDVLAVAYRDTLGNITGTMLANFSDTTHIPIFKLIKPRTPRHTDQTWDLGWKNVYYLGSRNIDLEGFELKMYYKTPSGDPDESIEIDGTPRGFLNIFGLDNLDVTGSSNPDNVIDDDPNILSRSRGELIFPNLRPFDPDPSYNTKYPFPSEFDQLRTPAIYDTTSDNYIRQQSKFYIEVKSSKRSPNISLGMNVIEGSEEVLLNGVKMQKDVDYMIDYLSGMLTLLNENATNPNADLKINYESHQMISIDKKSLFGARAEYTLWETGTKRSFIGATLLYISQRTLDQRIRIGKNAPMNNLVWGANAALHFQPDFLTRALDNLPLLNVTSPSSISLEAEIAQVIPNPNTLNNDATGDHNGVAYLDDFEGAKRRISLSIIRTGWGPSSPPTESDSTLIYLARKGNLVWYNPFEQVPIQEIWPDKEVTNNYGGSTLQHVLTLNFTPNTNITNPLSSWGGIQRGLSSGYANQTDSRFLEIWVKGNIGRIHVDLGQISEDVIPNQERNTEDKKPSGGVRNEILDEDEDTGLDGIFGPDPPTMFHPHETSVIVNGTATPYDFFDIHEDGIKQEDEPWSYDNWQYESRSWDYSKINGTEGNRNDGTIIYPDTEDLNRNGDVDLNNNYFRFSLSLDKSHADTIYIAGGKGNIYGWRLYRIPLDKPSKIVNYPDWSRIEFTRICVDSVTQETQISLAEMNLVGNEWKLRGVMVAGDSLFNEVNDSTMTIAVINTHDNPEYSSPPGVEGEIDPLQKIRSKEQSLVINLTDLEQWATAIARKDFYSSETLINYKTLKMFVHGGDISGILPDSTLEFFLRWGSDTENKHYYEVRIPVYAGWNQKNNIEINFEDLSRLKIEMQSALTDTISEIQENGHTITVVGKPSLTNIRWLIIGAQNVSGYSYTGQVWIDELRVSNIRKDKGLAMRARADIKLSDFITLNGEYNRKDADFHTVNERFGRGSNSRSGTFNASIQVHKLLPPAWGLRIPVSISYNKSRQTPKYLPGSDILVTKNTVPDSLLKLIRTENQTKGLNISLSKQKKSRNFWIRYLFDPVQGKFSYTKSDRSDSKTLYSTNVGYKGNFSYNLSFGDQHYWYPFKWLGEKSFLKKIAQTKFYYLPKRISFTMDGSDSKKDSETSGGVVSLVATSNFSRKFSTSLSPFKPITFDFTRSQTSDMRNSKWTAILSSAKPGDPLSTNQQISVNLNPSFVSWLTSTAKYSATYRWNDNPQQRSQGTSQSASINNSLSLNGSINPARLVQSLKKKTAPTTRRTRRPAPRITPTKKDDTDDKQQDDEEKKPFPLFSVFSFFGKVFQKIDPITVKFSETKAASNYGILGTPSFSYQIGTTLDPGVPVSPNVTSDRSSQKNNQSITVSSGVKITSKLSVNFDYRFSNVHNKTTQVTGTITNSAFKWKNTDFPFPNWRVSWRGLEKLPVLSMFTKTVSLNHDFSGKKTVTWNESKSNVTSISISKDFRPLLRASITFKNGINAIAQYSKSETVQEQKTYGRGKTKSIVNDLSFTVKYSKRGGFSIPFFKKKLDNSINFSLTFSKKLNSTSQNRTSGDTFTETARTENWSVKPDISYSFTRTVQGGLHLELGERKDIRLGTTKFTAFGLNAIISLSGG